MRIDLHTHSTASDGTDTPTELVRRAHAAGLQEGLPIANAVGRAAVAASLSVQVEGARDGLPTRAQIDAAMPA